MTISQLYKKVRCYFHPSFH